MSLIEEIDYGTPRSYPRRRDHHRRQQRHRARRHLHHARGMEAGTQIPKLCATDMVDAFGSCRLCLVEIEGRAGTPASCTTPVMNGIVVHTQTERLKKLRKGVMEFYISDHPLDCLTCAANGDCELQDMAGAVGLRDVRYGYEGENHVPPSRTAAATTTGCRRTNPTRTSPTILEMHRLLALRARLRGGAGHLRTDHLGPRLRQPGIARHERKFSRSECVSCGACVACFRRRR